ncbi:hypothetical protein BaRGS_00001481 [Batillaria attramentaria]|uniref:Uncharacterized protein n=1 Tax=Batillaria attramentaria TaxID=370345 RepID=A0ABD0M846_9CAEN
MNWACFWTRPDAIPRLSEPPSSARIHLIDPSPTPGDLPPDQAGIEDRNGNSSCRDQRIYGGAWLRLAVLRIYLCFSWRNSDQGNRR